MAYIGKGPEQVLSGVASKSTFTGDGSTTTFDISTDIPAGGENDIQVFVDNVRQEPGSGASYTVGVDGSGNLRRITFSTAPEASQSIYVINPRRIEAVGAIADNTVTTAKLQADAVTEAKIADNAISEEHLDTTVITGLTELSETANDSDVLIIYDASAGTLKKVLKSNVTLQVPTISSVSPTSVVSGDGTGNYTFTITGTNLTGGSASLINSSNSTVSFDTVTVDSATQITGVIAKSSLPNSGEPYDVKVSSSAGLTATLENQINIDASPTYNTAAGSLGTVFDGSRGSTTLTVEAYDPESAGNVTFEIQSGSLPAGATATTVHENGVSKYQISGFSAVGSNTTSNFVLRAVDAASNTSSRSFSITVNAPVSQSFTTSGTFSVPSGVTSVTALVVAGGGGSGRRGGGGGAGGLVFMPGYPVTPGGTVTVTVGCGGGPASTQTGPTMRGEPGSDSVFGTLTAKGGGGGGGAQTGGTLNACESPNLRAGRTGGSGGGSARDGSPGVTGSPGPATQPTQPGNSGAYGFGNIGGYSQTCSSSGGGGGGGAGAAGAQGGAAGQPGYHPRAVMPYEFAGDGGIGKSYTIADGTTPVYYAGGGGGTVNAPAPVEPTNRGYGGQGGGGQGGFYCSNQKGQSGTANRGGGAGGGSESETPVGASGGKGIVIVRY